MFVKTPTLNKTFILYTLYYYVLELFPVVISVHIWGIHLKNKQIIFNVDNQAVVAIINKKPSKSKRVMTLVKSCFTVFTI